MSNYTFELDEFAEAEFYNIVDYYNQFAQSLSADFIQDFDQSILRLKAFPKAGTTYFHSTRRVILNRFPYAIVYKIYEEELIVVHAVMHMKRKPKYWKDRLQ